MIEFEKSVIFLNGFPGTGKLTIAKDICRQSNILLYDNHTSNNVLFSLFTQEQIDNLPNDRLSDERQKINDVIYQTFIQHVPKENSYVFTGGCMDGRENTRKHYKEFEDLQENKRGATFLPIQLICERQELLKRVTSNERAKKHKLRNVKILEDILNKNKLMPLDQLIEIIPMP